MAFPLTITRIIPVFNKSDFEGLDQHFIDKVFERLNSKGIQFERLGNLLRFQGLFFRYAWNGYHILNPVYKGEVALEMIDGAYQVKYTLNFLEMLIISFIFSPLALLFLFQPWMAAFYLAIVWIGFYFGSMLIAGMRINKLINKLLDIYELPIENTLPKSSTSELIIETNKTENQ